MIGWLPTSQGAASGFLRTIAGRFKHTGGVVIHDLDGFVELSDEPLNAQPFGPELIAWLKA